MDACFVLFRPTSFEWTIYKPYTDIYIHIDRGYGDLFDGFVIAQSYLNLIEMIFNLFAIYYYYTNNTILSNAWCFIATLCTFWKTVLYLLRDVCGGKNGFEFSGHNSWNDFIIFYVIPNGIWIILPFAVLYHQFNALFVRQKSRDSKKRK